jgi:Putative prokaryotic signal transducing protein
MKLLCASNSIAFAQSLRIALDAEGIETYCSDPDLALASIAGPIGGGGGRVYVLDEADWPRALEILAELSPPKPAASAPAASARRLPTWLMAGVAALATVLLVLALGSK